MWCINWTISVAVITIFPIFAYRRKPDPLVVGGVCTEIISRRIRRLYGQLQDLHQFHLGQEAERNSRKETGNLRGHPRSHHRKGHFRESASHPWVCVGTNGAGTHPVGHRVYSQIPSAFHLRNVSTAPVGVGRKTADKPQTAWAQRAPNLWIEKAVR